MIRRREVIALLGGAAAAWPFAARGQQSALPLIGYLDSTSPLNQHNVTEFRKGLNDTGYVEGRNVAIEFRAPERYGDLAALVTDLVSHRPAVLVGRGLPAALAAKRATTVIPIVFFLGGDPVRAGLVTSLSHPSGNLTGVTNLNSPLLAKRLGLLRELVPSPGVIAVLLNPDNPNAASRLSDLNEAARSVGQEIVLLKASREEDFAGAFAAAATQHATALLIIDDPFLGTRSEQLATLAISHALPALSFSPVFAAAGGLAAYAVADGQAYPQMGAYVGRILNGERPANLPVVQGAKFTLSINLKSAKALGITVPQTLLAIADEVIE